MLPGGLHTALQARVCPWQVALPLQAEAMSVSSRLLAASAVLTALLALFWPQLESLVTTYLSHNGTDSKCPLGYTGPNPHSWAGGSSSASPASDVTWYINCTVWTADAQRPWASYLAVDRRGRVTTQPLPTPQALRSLEQQGRVHNLGGGWVMPGFIDPHLHLIPGGLSLQAINLRAARSKQQFQQLIADAAAAAPSGGEWLVGFGWDETTWGGETPDASWIDEALDAATQQQQQLADMESDDSGKGGSSNGARRQRPAFMVRMDGHMAVANSAALEATGVIADTPDPEHGAIGRGADGSPTGVLRETAMLLVRQHIPPPTLQQRQAALEAAARHLLSLGVTSVGDMGRAPFANDEASWEDLEQLYDPAADAGALPIRIHAFVPLATWGRMATRVAAAGKQHPGGHLSWGAVKEFADGSLGSRTALMWQPYADDPTTSGLRQVDLGVFGERVKGAAEAGLQVGVHAIGDRAVDEVVQVLQQHTQPCSSSSSSSSTSKKRRCVRHRVEHVQHISGPEAAQQLAGTATAVTNPLHLLPDRAMLEQRLGRERAGAGRSYAYRTLAAAGVVLAHSSDWPIVEMDPLGSVYAAAFRKSLGAQEAAWAGEEQLSVEQALLGHTTGAAVAIGAEGRVGKLAEGMLADFVVLSSSPLLWQGTAADARPQVLQTFLGGRCAHGCLSEGVRKSS